MENNQNIQIPAPSLVVAQEAQAITPPISEELKPVIQKHSLISYVLIVLSIVQAISVFFGQIGTVQIIGAIYYVVTAIFLFKKPVVGYIMFGVAAVLFVSMLVLYSVASQF